ncbi:MAG TPA: 5-formyltetrahydrofolate cyclo-ligase, partial [Methanobacterium sp.]|nr:5-formyltetrahydrofolate cyclo-ligase [Methanobacterium sp.]
VKGNEETASTINGAFKFGKKIHEFPEVDLVVEGSVAVDKSGNRLGKGYYFLECSRLSFLVFLYLQLSLFLLYAVS